MTTAVLDAGATLIAGLMAIPCLVLAAEIAVGLVNGRARPVPSTQARLCVMMPAHDEAETIAPTLRALRANVPAGTRILVIADNCSDETAAVARGCGVEVIERHDPQLRGKGYALAFGRDHLANDTAIPAPDVVMILDADCAIDSPSIARLVAACVATGRPAQAKYVLLPGGAVGPLVQISCFAFALKNLVRARGLCRMIGCVTLTGSGMAFPWGLVRDLPLASGHLVEDMELGIELVRQGRGAVLVSDAQVTSVPASQGATLAQRRRWEHGFLSVATRLALPLVVEGVMKRKIALIGLGLDLLVPPLALMVGLVCLAFALIGLAWAAGAAAAPLWWFGASAALAGLMVLLAWAVHGRTLLRPAALLRVPLYIVWKLPLYLRFLTGRETRWVRTRRD